MHVVFVGDEVVSGNFPSTFTYKTTEAQKERPDLTVSIVMPIFLKGQCHENSWIPLAS